MERKLRQRGAKVGEEAVLHVTVTELSGKVEKNRKEKQRVIAVREFQTDPAYVRVNAGMTKSLAPYESLRVDVSLSVPCYTEEIDDVFPAVADKVAAYLASELKNYDN